MWVYGCKITKLQKVIQNYYMHCEYDKHLISLDYKLHEDRPMSVFSHHCEILWIFEEKVSWWSLLIWITLKILNRPKMYNTYALKTM